MHWNLPRRLEQARLTAGVLAAISLSLAPATAQSIQAAVFAIFTPGTGVLTFEGCNVDNVISLPSLPTAPACASTTARLRRSASTSAPAGS
jgi:hypothetical protein